jgi:hypothetical protein
MSDICLQWVSQFINGHSNRPFYAGMLFPEAHSPGGPVTAILDKLLVNFLNQLIAQRPNTIVIVQSDHGVRHEHIQQWEIFNPALIFSLPSAAVSPEHLSALKSNSHQITSHFDVYETLRHIVAGSLKPPQTSFCGQSLLTTLSRNRSCNDACVPSHICFCQGTQINVSTATATELVSFATVSINKKYQLNSTSVCQPFKILSIEKFSTEILYGELSSAKPLMAVHVVIRVSSPTRPTNKQAQFSFTMSARCSDPGSCQPVGEPALLTQLTEYQPFMTCIASGHKHSTDGVHKEFCLCRSVAPDVHYPPA